MVSLGHPKSEQTWQDDLNDDEEDIDNYKEDAALVTPSSSEWSGPWRDHSRLQLGGHPQVLNESI